MKRSLLAALVHRMVENTSMFPVDPGRWSVLLSGRTFRRRRPCNPFKTSGELRLLALFLVAPLMAGAAGCALPIMPGCTPDDSLPGGEMFLGLGIVATNLSSTVHVDRTGRSRFSPDYTAWMLSTVAVCRTISAEDLLALENAWKQVAHDPCAPRFRTKEERPYLGVTYHVDDERRGFSLKPGEAGQRPDLEHAVGLTLAVFERTFGDRFVRELRGAGLQDLLHGAR